MVRDDMGGTAGLMQDSMPKTTVSATGTTTSDISSSFFTNYPLWSALIAFAIAQSSKFIASWTMFLPPIGFSFTAESTRDIPSPK